MALAALAGPVGMPGAALVLALLLLPALFLVSNPLLAVLPFAAIPLGAIGALAGAPALIAVLAGRTWERAILGGVAFSAYLAGAITIGAGSRLGIAGRAPDGWESSASVALNDVVVPLLEPAALLGVAVLAAASVVLGFMLRAHPALALIGAMIWSAALAAGLEAVGNGAQGAECDAGRGGRRHRRRGRGGPPPARASRESATPTAARERPARASRRGLTRRSALGFSPNAATPGALFERRSA